MLLNKPRTQEGLQVLMWIVIIEVTMDVKNLKIINTIETATNVLRSSLNCRKGGCTPKNL